MSRSGWARWCGGALIGLLLATGCGISAESDAHRMDAEDVPFDLLAELPTSEADSEGQPIKVFLWKDQLVEVERSIPPGTGIDGVVAALAAGPTEQERANGISTSLPAGEVSGVDLGRGVAVVDLAPSFADLRSIDQRAAIAQLVYTLTAQPGVGRVAFTLDSQPVEVPSADGSLTTDALAREDVRRQRDTD